MHSSYSSSALSVTRKSFVPARNALSFPLRIVILTRLVEHFQRSAMSCIVKIISGGPEFIVSVGRLSMRIELLVSACRVKATLDSQARQAGTAANVETLARKRNAKQDFSIAKSSSVYPGINVLVTGRWLATF
jgi:hypothetical protein